MNHLYDLSLKLIRSGKRRRCTIAGRDSGTWLFSAIGQEPPQVTIKKKKDGTAYMQKTKCARQLRTPRLERVVGSDPMCYGMSTHRYDSDEYRRLG